jgi:hypothetical protein
MTGRQQIPDGAFPGRLFRVNYDPSGDDYLCLEAHLPIEHVLELHRTLKANPTLQLSISVHLLSFSYEVDDALREPHHGRALIIDDMTLAPLHGVSIQQGDWSLPRASCRVSVFRLRGMRVPEACVVSDSRAPRRDMKKVPDENRIKQAGHLSRSDWIQRQKGSAADPSPLIAMAHPFPTASVSTRAMTTSDADLFSQTE